MTTAVDLGRKATKQTTYGIDYSIDLLCRKGIVRFIGISVDNAAYVCFF